MHKVSIIIGRVPSVVLDEIKESQWKAFEQKYHEYIKEIPNFLQEFAGELVVMYDLIDEIRVDVSNRTPYARHVLQFFNVGENRPLDFSEKGGFPLEFYSELKRIFEDSSFLVSVFDESAKRIELYRVHLDDKSGLRWSSVRDIF